MSTMKSLLKREIFIIAVKIDKSCDLKKKLRIEVH